MFTAQPLFRIGPAVYPRHLLVGKFFAMILLGALIGHLMGKSLAADAARGEALTRDAYVANFDTYKADLIAEKEPMAGMMVAGVLFVIGTLVTYEAAAVFISWGVAWLSPGAGPAAPEAAEP